jgi:G protein-coupled receptor Mth (Methuselah protein)
VLNVVLFSLTAMQLWRLKREAARAFKSSSIRVVTPAGNRQHKDRFTLYIKLFLLMGVTWIMEVVSWAIGGPDSIWYITDTVNCLRGVLIFWFCVWCNKNVRKVFLDAFSRCWCKRSTQSSSMDAAHGSSLSTDISAL